MMGSLVVAGLGPGSDSLITPEVVRSLADATDVLGYTPYVERIAPREGLKLHPSDNREELARARAGLQIAASGGRAVIVSSGDPGVFAMAAAVFEVLEDVPQWQQLDIRVLPGVTAMLAAAASIGAPLGHDFCAINLSDNLKPWALIEKRLRLAAEAGFAIALYNPRSAIRPAGFARPLEILKTAGAGGRLAVFARAVTTPQERLEVHTVRDARADLADMRTIVIICNAETRRVGRWLYAPRQVS